MIAEAPVKKDVEAIYPLTPLQEGMLYHTISEPDSGVYFEQYTAMLFGLLDVEAFRSAWQQVIDRHPTLRTLFTWEKREKPLQVVRSQVELPYEVLDWRHLSSQQQNTEFQVILRADREASFNLGKAPLMRITLMRLDEESTRLVWSFHHLLLDGWSGPLVFKEVFAFYEATRRGTSHHLPTPRRYRDYVTWLGQQDMVAAESYWRSTLGDFAAPTKLQLLAPAQELTGESYLARQHSISLETTTALKTFAQQQRCTLNNLVQAAWGLLLSIYSGDEDLVFGVTLSGRSGGLPGIEHMVGLCINTLPMRLKIDPRMSLAEWLRAIQAQQAQLVEFEYSSLVDVQGWSGVPRGQSLFESIVVFENYPVDTSARPNNSLTIADVRAIEQTNFPLTLAVLPASQLILQISYQRDRFHDADVSRMLLHLESALQNMLKTPQATVADISILTDAERHQLINGWNNTQQKYRDETTLVQLFAAQVARTPESVALKEAATHITYAELDKRSNQLAHYLIQKGVGLETMVGVSMERSIDTVVALLGILKAGGAYVPMDPAYPRDRLELMLRDSQVSIVLTQSHLVAGLPASQAQLICMDTDWPVIAGESPEAPTVVLSPDNALFVLYTSGSTGTPKGVVGLHRGMVNRFRWMWQHYPFANDEVCCQKTSLSFVDSVWETFGPLLQGITSVIVSNDDSKDVSKLLDVMSKNRVTRLVLVPSLLQVMLDTADVAQQLPYLRLVVTSGEALPVALAQRFQQHLPETKLINLYGSTEVSADITAYDLSNLPENLSNTPIGKPIANSVVYLLDRFMNPVPVGLPGELYASGEGLARGYFNRTDITAERFVPNPFKVSGYDRLFKTGDFARYLPDGTIEYIGRSDQQVKIRGFRIELGEIETTLARHDAVSEVVVEAHTESGGGKRLVAYLVVNTDSTQSTNDFREYLSQKLPDYMIPSSFVRLESLPHLPNGKVNRRALSSMQHNHSETSPASSSPDTLVESRLKEIWEELLGVSNIGIHDNFFELGGHSLLAVRLFARIEKTFNVKLPVARLFGAPTIKQLAEIVDGESGYSSWFSLVVLQMHGKKPPFFMMHELGGCVGEYDVWSKHLGNDQPFFGLRALGYGEQEPYNRVEDMAAHYVEQIQSVQPSGPYYIGGYAFGGIIAFEVAHQLYAKGHHDNFIVIINTEAPNSDYRRYHVTPTFLLRFARNFPYWLQDFARLDGKEIKKRLRRTPANVKSIEKVDRELDPDFFHPRAKIVEANYQAMLHYQARQYPGQLTLIRTKRQPLLCSFDPAMGWSPLAERGIVVKAVPGSTTTVITNPSHARSLADELGILLAEARQRFGQP